MRRDDKYKLREKERKSTLISQKIMYNYIFLFINKNKEKTKKKLKLRIIFNGDNNNRQRNKVMNDGDKWMIRNERISLI